MHDVAGLLELAKSVAAGAGEELIRSASEASKKYVHSATLPREIKAGADAHLDNYIIDKLKPAGLPIHTEESGEIPGRESTTLRFIVDPLDGTFNFVKGLGKSAVSIALWDSATPVFGVIYVLDERVVVWGGVTLGAFSGRSPIRVSNTSAVEVASICTGFPSRFDVRDAVAGGKFLELVGPFAKVRMLGSAAVSLVNVARGAADVYSEENIMLWDIAAGLAIVEGAGGRFSLTPSVVPFSYSVYASNGELQKESDPGRRKASEI
jgi:myo-inositol-1(or 4)-monophosphatase